MDPGFYPYRTPNSVQSNEYKYSHNNNNPGNNPNHKGNYPYNNGPLRYPYENGPQYPGQENSHMMAKTNFHPRAVQNAVAVARAGSGSQGQGHDPSQGHGVLREGHLAAALEQIHENDLHGVEAPQPQQQQVRKPEGRRPEMKSNNLGLHQRPRVRQDNGYQDSELTTKFDPLRDRHLWTMWRTAVNGRIVDAVRRSNTQPPSSSSSSSITSPPLARFIKLQAGSRELAQELSNEGRGQLQASQFVFYGLPRVVMDRGPPQ